MLNKSSLLTCLGLLYLSCTTLIKAQTLPSGQETSYNPISTAVPFLNITPDSRHGAMGDVGAATSADANSQYLNPSKFAFIEENSGFAISYTPWLRKIANDINLAYLSGYYRLDQNQVLGTSLRYFSYGDVQLTDQNGSNTSNVRPNEFALDFSYSRKLSETFSGGIALRYIRTDLSGGFSQQSYSAGGAFASDVSFFYKKNWDGSGEKTFASGINISNIGSKISYNDGQTKDFLPANMRLGASFTNKFNENNSFSFSLDFNKLLVPTPSLKTISGDNNSVILQDNNSNVSVIEGIFSSFSDAPGGFKEELQEITVSTGVEYYYNKRFSIRTGYFNEAKTKGNRKFVSAGAGMRMNLCSIDFSYLIPTNQNNPLANTIRFTILFNSESFRKKADPDMLTMEK